MSQFHDYSTRSSLLARVANLSNQTAWVEFVRYYDPLLRQWCRRFALNADLADELCQRMWIELSRRMPSYRYDPAGSFRGWLWFLFRHRALNLLKQRRGEVACLIDATLFDGEAFVRDDGDDEPDERILALIREGAQIHENVRRRVKPGRWEADRRIIVQREDVTNTAADLGISYAAAYAAARYVDGMVRAQGRGREDEATPVD